jgi:hypothetical protein
MALKVCFLGAVRRRTFICCRKVQISASSAARDRIRSTTVQTMSLTRSLIAQQHRPILDQLLVRLGLRQGQVHRRCTRMVGDGSDFLSIAGAGPVCDAPSPRPVARAVLPRNDAGLQRRNGHRVQHDRCGPRLNAEKDSATPSVAKAPLLVSRILHHFDLSSGSKDQDLVGVDRCVGEFVHRATAHAVH